ncbi:hypothetical protein [Arthrobacter sp. UM1]|uniref:hypothetical protein n=1 Tax=Arthrobacter sp. UM1 TaxID=2766776 RepID=UPI001CF6D324|nr:hypothetical protein [Arthrobacter sp. UM1]MCB4208394.1 hypothetical protein [Arthrobacter sp. UM1]
MVLNGFISDIHHWMGGLSPVLQWLMLIVLGAVPFVEAFLSAMVGTLLGIPAPLSIAAGIAGNLLAVSLCTVFGKTVRGWWQRRRARLAEEGRGHRFSPSAVEGREETKLARVLRRYGVPGLCLLGPLTVPSQAVALVAAGTSAPRSRVLLLIAVPAVVLGVVGGVLGALGVNLLTR